MRSSASSWLLITKVVVVVAASIVTFLLICAIGTDADTVAISHIPQVPDAEIADPVLRLAFVRQGALWKPKPADEEPETHAASGETTNAAVQWSTLTISETPAVTPPTVQSTAFPRAGFPWLQTKPHVLPQPRGLQARLAELAPTANVRLAAKFAAAKVLWPPAEIALIAIKDEKILELYARPSGGMWKLVHRYPVLAASGGAGPKLRQGDRQVPEGIYGIALLNPNSAYHVSLRVNYPNEFDRHMAVRDGRSDLGGDIMIHGKNLSAGCLAMGDEAAEELFLLASQTGLANVKLIIAPTDLRRNAPPSLEPSRPNWLPHLYAEIAAAMSEFKSTQNTGLFSFFGN